MEQRKILILTGNFGMGHRCVAEAIRQQLAAMHTHAQIQVLDLMDALFPNSSALLYRGFAQMVHYCPSLYNQLNKITGRCSTLPMQSWIADKMKELLKDAEIVVSTFPLCAQFAAMYKRKYHASTALYTYITDIGAQDEWIVPDTDFYFFGAQETNWICCTKALRRTAFMCAAFRFGRIFYIRFGRNTAAKRKFC